MSVPAGTIPVIPRDTLQKDAESHHSTTNSSTKSNELSPHWQEKNLLSLDGGGIRGYWSLCLLQRLMEAIGEEERRAANEHNAQLPANSISRQTRIDSFWPQDCPPNLTHVDVDPNDPDALLRDDQKFLPIHYFDTICGSSTGGLIAIMLGRFRMTVADCLEEYENLGRRVFGKPRWASLRTNPLSLWTKYSATELEKVFKDVTKRRCELDARGENNFNAPTFPTMEGTCNVFVTACRQTTGPRGAGSKTKYLIRSYDNGPSNLSRSGTSATRPTQNYGSKEAMTIWQVARAATAAPLYFKPLECDNAHGPPGTKFHFSDGGFGAENNPCFQGIEELKKVHGHVDQPRLNVIGAVVSVGTSRAARAPGGVSLFMDTVMGLTEEATSASVYAEVLRALNLKDYCRFNDEIGLPMELDECEPNGWLTPRKNRGSKTLQKIRNAFNAWAIKAPNDNKIRQCARILVARRRARTVDASLWEQYATGASRFRCKSPRCKPVYYTFRYQFDNHFRERHQGKPEYEEPDYSRWRYSPKGNW